MKNKKVGFWMDAATAYEFEVEAQAYNFSKLETFEFLLFLSREHRAQFEAQEKREAQEKKAAGAPRRRAPAGAAS